MTELSNAVGRELVESITSLVKPKSNGETRRCDVTRVDPGGRTWVRIEGNDFDTCCTRSSVACKPGDSVSVTLRNNRATIEGNYTSPATDDSMAREAIKTGSSAQQTADMARELATNAIADAQATRDAAERAEADATRAAVAAESSEASARASAASAASAADSAASAAASAFSANESAESAYLAALGSITSLGTVENVIESLKWLKDNPAYKKCPDGKYIDPTCDYYQIVDGEYVKVENPTVKGIPTYYVIDATATAAAYVDSKLAVTDAGLYVTKDKLLTWAEGDEMPDGSGTIGAPELDEEGNPILDDEGNPVIIGADLIGMPKPQEAGYVLLGVDGVTIYSKEGYPVATYGSSMKLGYGASSTTIESDMIEVIRTDIPTKVEYNVFAAGRRLANPEQPESSTNPMLPFVQFSDGYGHDLFTVDSTGKPTFAKPVPIPSGGTNATTVEGARDSLGVPSYTVAGQHWQIGEPDGTHDLWMRVPTPGILPDASTTNTTGRGSLGANSWYFASAYVANYYGTWKGNPLSWSDLDTGVQDFVNNASFSAHARTTDLNPLMNGVKWWGSDCANIPSGESYGIVATFSNGTDPKSTGLWRRQIALSTTGRTYTRQCINCPATTASTSWTSWIRVWDLSSILPVANGGTGLTTSPSLLINLASTSATSVFQALPRPGVTGALGIANGGTGATTAANARSNLGLTRNATEGWSNITVEPYSSTTNASNFGLAKRGGTVQITFWGTVIKSSSSRVEIATIPAGYRPLYTVYDPGSGLIINESGKVLSDKHDGSAMWASCCWTVA